MKKIITLLFLAGLLLACAGAGAEGDFTLLMYLCGSDMPEDACEDIYEMGLAETGENVNLVVLAGGSSEWVFDEIEGGTRNLVTIRDGYFESVTDWGWASMGSQESLEEFLAYGLTEYPAERTAVILWDHGAGSEAGICFDDTTADQDGLSLLEIDGALRTLQRELDGFHIDLFGCDACMMATYEMAVMLSQYDIDYFVASEELEPGAGWHYTPWLEALDSNPALPTSELCRLIADSYMKAGLEDCPDDYLTLSAVDLRQMQPLQAAMEGLGASLHTELQDGRAAELRRGRSRLYTFGSFVDGSWDMVDLGAMLDTYAHLDPGGAAEARTALNSAVLFSRQTDNLNPCSGLSVLIPQDTKNEFESYAAGLDLSLYIPNWTGFVKAYAGQLTGGSYSFGQTTPQNITGSGFLADIAGIFQTGAGAWSWDEDDQVYVEEAATDIAISAGEGDYAFSATLTPQDLQYLDYVEGMLMMDVSDEEIFAFVDLGLMQNNVIDWNSGAIYSLFDGAWPILDGQLVPLYDQINNEYGRRSLIPVKLNGEYTYLVVEFPAGSAEGRIIGANAGYDENGLPIRHTTRLQAGDRIVPVYTMYYSTEEDEDAELEEDEFEGDEIIWRDGLTVTFEELGDEGEPMEMMFCFILNDVFGDWDMTDVIAFEV